MGIRSNNNLSGGDDRESAASKNAALAKAGAHVPRSFDEFADKIKETFKILVDSGEVVVKEEPEPPAIPDNYSSAMKEGRVRRQTGIISTICDDRGEEPTYAGQPISELIEQVCCCSWWCVSLRGYV